MNQSRPTCHYQYHPRHLPHAPTQPALQPHDSTQCTPASTANSTTKVPACLVSRGPPPPKPEASIPAKPSLPNMPVESLAKSPKPGPSMAAPPSDHTATSYTAIPTNEPATAMTVPIPCTPPSHHSNFMNSLTPSPTTCSKPNQPHYEGPKRR